MLMLNAGAYDTMDACIMCVYPTESDVRTELFQVPPEPWTQERNEDSLFFSQPTSRGHIHWSYVRLPVTKAPFFSADLCSRAHAAAAPWEGKNAMDAAVLAYTNVSLLRQQIHPSHRVHGVFEGQDLAVNSMHSCSPMSSF